MEKDLEKKEKKEKNEKKELKPITLDTMACVAKDIKLAGRTYKVCPVNISDMYLILTAGELYIPIKSKEDIEENEENELALQLTGLNVTNEKFSKNFFYITEKYARYENMPVTKELIEEHNWSFKDIKDFLIFWTQIVSD